MSTPEGGKGGTLRRRAPRWLAALGWLGLLGIVSVVAWGAWPVAKAELRARRARAEMIDAIASAASPAAMRDVATVYVLPDGSWIAMDYRDSHHLWYSVSVALTSDGTWYTSREHYCGAFGGYAADLHSMRAFLSAIPPEDESQRRAIVAAYGEAFARARFGGVAEANSLAMAKEELLALDYQPRRVGRKPALAGPQEWPAPSPEVLRGDKRPRIITGRRLRGHEP